MTFSVAEINDLKARATTIAAFGDFSTTEFTLLGMGEPRRARGRGRRFLLRSHGTAAGAGPAAERYGRWPRRGGAVVLTHRFWTSLFNAIPP